YQQEYERGHVLYDLKIIGETTETGTQVHFSPDEEIFQETTIYDYDGLMTRIRELAFLNKGLTLSIEDLRENQQRKDEFFYEGGINSYVAYLNQNKQVLFENPIYIEGEQDDIQVEVSLQYNDTYY
ncbi:DNA topoisomerase IV subunit B, partial [Francisella tularensis subsp. holarctica]|nr:DNA topoisomerase IV subunit B [Francisella tularensis subsp. holarctica]